MQTEAGSLTYRIVTGVKLCKGNSVDAMRGASVGSEWNAMAADDLRGLAAHFRTMALGAPHLCDSMDLYKLATEYESAAASLEATGACLPQSILLPV
ncbi:MAG: hypothetical protein M3Q16_03035 [Pseudomonadota bacterium]|nr:hypothetical protein [Pseudomonadota bacterium]